MGLQMGRMLVSSRAVFAWGFAADAGVGLVLSRCSTALRHFFSWEGVGKIYQELSLTLFLRCCISRCLRIKALQQREIPRSSIRFLIYTFYGLANTPRTSRGTDIRVLPMTNSIPSKHPPFNPQSPRRHPFASSLAHAPPQE